MCNNEHPVEAPLVLVVDENADRRLNLYRTLIRLGCSVLEAENGRQALQRWTQSRSRIRLVMTDLQMPDLCGETLIRMLRAGNQEIPIVALSSLSGPTIEFRLRTAGATLFLPEPVQPDVVASAVSRLLNGSIPPLPMS